MSASASKTVCQNSTILYQTYHAETWFSAKITLFEFKKTKTIFFHSKKVNNPVNIKINNTSIESIGEHREKEEDKYIKFLDFKIDAELTFNLFFFAVNLTLRIHQ